jgi:hypothetical protein
MSILLYLGITLICLIVWIIWYNEKTFFSIPFILFSILTYSLLIVIIITCILAWFF